MPITQEQAEDLRRSVDELLTILLSGNPMNKDLICVRKAYALLKATPGPITLAFANLAIPEP